MPSLFIYPVTQLFSSQATSPGSRVPGLRVSLPSGHGASTKILSGATIPFTATGTGPRLLRDSVLTSTFHSLPPPFTLPSPAFSNDRLATILQLSFPLLNNNHSALTTFALRLQLGSRLVPGDNIIAVQAAKKVRSTQGILTRPLPCRLLGYLRSLDLLPCSRSSTRDLITLSGSSSQTSLGQHTTQHRGTPEKLPFTSLSVLLR